jgi:nucleoside-diphosphate-sugar epimerase
MSRVLVTGASGFVGRQTLAPLTSAGFEVHAITSRRSRIDSSPGVRWHHADLLAGDSAGALVGRIRPSHLLHIAWYAEPVLCRTASVNLDWVQASLRLLRAFAEAGGARAVMVGSSAEYSLAPRMHCVEGETATCPTSLYGAAKHGLHVVAAAWARHTGVALAWGRVFNLYGPHEHPGQLVGALARALIRGEAIATSHGRQVRDFLYVPDLGAALAALLSSDLSGSLNVASGIAVRVADVIAAIVEAAGRPELVQIGARPTPPGEPEQLTADVRRLREDVGWTPAVELREGAARTVAWWRKALA